MSDETRTVTVEDIERAIREIAPVVGGELQAGGIKHHVGLAHAIFAALPTSTEGLDANLRLAMIEHWVGHHLCDADCIGEIERRYARLVSLSPSPTEDPA